MAVIPALVLDRNRATPLYRQIEAELRRAVLDRRLSPGARLPSVRELAPALGVARVTVAEAYGQLVAEGYLVATVGSGTRVAARLPDESLFRDSGGGHGAGARGGGTVSALGPAPDGASRRRPWRFDLRPGGVAADQFPTAVWERLLRDAWRTLSPGASGSRSMDEPSAWGHPALRQGLADYVGAARSIRCAGEDVVVTAGGGEGLASALRQFAQIDICAIDDPGVPAVGRVLADLGVTPRPIPVGAGGMAAEAIPDDADAVLVAPAWQVPLGGAMSLDGRRGLLRWARGRGGTIVETDHHGQVRYRGHPLPAIRGLDGGAEVLYVGSFDGAMFPGFRVGFAIAPAAAPRGAAWPGAGDDLGDPTVEQVAFAWFLGEGLFDRHLRRLRRAYLERQEALVEALRRSCGRALAAEPADAGTHVLVHLMDSQLDAREVQRQARRRGVLVGTLSEARVGSADEDALLIGFANHPPADLRDAVRELSTAIRWCLREEAFAGVPPAPAA